MKRKTFVKQLMALGVTRNYANGLCKRYIEEREVRRSAGNHKIRVAWEYVFAGLLLEYDAYVQELPREVMEEEKARYRRWRAKRTKEDPMYNWIRNHPNNI